MAKCRLLRMCRNRERIVVLVGVEMLITTLRIIIISKLRLKSWWKGSEAVEAMTSRIAVGDSRIIPSRRGGRIMGAADESPHVEFGVKGR